jgi:hypothetical protein
MAETIERGLATEREHLARIISDLIEEHAHCDTRWPATARIAQDKALVFADAILSRLPAAPASQSTERDRVLEEAAQVAIEISNEVKLGGYPSKEAENYYESGADDAGRVIAAAIRAMKGISPPPAGAE